MARPLYKPVLLALLCIAGLVLAGCTRPERVLDLSQAWARTGPIGTPGPGLGKASNRMYLRQGWTQGRSIEYRKCVGSRSEVVFYVDQARDLELSLNGFAPIEAGVHLLLNDEFLARLDLEKGEFTEVLQLESGQTVAGRNTLSLVRAKGTEWELIRVAPRGAVSKSPSRQAGRIALPFGRSLSYPVVAQAGDSLVLGGLDEWKEPGVSGSPAYLKVTVEREAPLTSKSWKFTKATSLKLEPGPLNLTLESVSIEDKHPGQWGLLLEDLRVEGTPRVSPSPPISPSPRQPPKSRPNVVLYLVDTLRPDRLACYGSAVPTSPELDKLALDGVVYERAQAQAPWTKPSVASIFTGLEPTKHGAIRFSDKLPARVSSLPEILKEAGYHTAGWVANAWVGESYGFGQGFDTYEYHVRESAEFLQARATAWISTLPKGEPFFLYLHSLEPHAPYAPPEPFATKWAPQLQPITKFQLRRYQEELRNSEMLGEELYIEELERMTKLYAGEVACVDDSFGQLMDWLKERDLYHNTLVIVVSDHGEEFLEHGGLNHIQSLYQELLWVPLLVKYPAQRDAGKRIKQVVQHLDLGPTILAEAGLEWDPNLKGSPLGTITGPRDVFSDVNVGSDKTVYDRETRPFLYEARSLRQGDLVLIETKQSRRTRHEPLELYDLSTDPEQVKNLIFERPVTLLRLQAKLERESPGSAEQVSPAVLTETLKSLPYVE